MNDLEKDGMRLYDEFVALNGREPYASEVKLLTAQLFPKIMKQLNVEFSEETQQQLIDLSLEEFFNQKKEN